MYDWAPCQCDFKIELESMYKAQWIHWAHSVIGIFICFLLFCCCCCWLLLHLHLEDVNMLQRIWKELAIHDFECTWMTKSECAIKLHWMYLNDKERIPMTSLAMQSPVSCESVPWHPPSSSTCPKMLCLPHRSATQGSLLWSCCHSHPYRSLCGKTKQFM